MVRFVAIGIAVGMLGSIAVAQSTVSGAKPQQDQGLQSALKGETPSGTPMKLPPMPPGKPTVIGGEIRNLDPVRDRFTLKVFGGQSMNVLYDARTQLYRDGVQAPLRSLRPDERASVETTLDGTDVFALRIHMLSQTPEGECQGQVMSYDPGPGTLTVRCDLTGDPIAFRVPEGTSILRMNQDASSSSQVRASELMKGSLVSVQFKPGVHGQGVATNIAITATPGSVFVFSGDLSLFDLHSGRMVVASGDGASYSISFDPARIPESRDLHQGSRVTVTATFDGTGYVATAIQPSDQEKIR
jgi:hypothetical protein